MCDQLAGVILEFEVEKQKSRFYLNSIYKGIEFDAENPLLVAVLHSLVRLLLHDAVGRDAVLRAIAQANVFGYLMVFLKETSIYIPYFTFYYV